MSERSTESKALDRVVDEARADAGPDLDWARIEASLDARLAIEAARSASPPPADPSRLRARLARGGVAALALAAAVAFFVGRDRPADPARPVVTAPERLAAGALRSTVVTRSDEGAGVVLVGGVVASAGLVLRGDDTVEANGARAVFERPGKVTWLVEHDRAPAKARVKSAGEPLVFDLERGAIEAQVVPVPRGEAFAVDVSTERSLIRVAVHGTHLRVSRDRTPEHDRVVVDLTEGVISIGVPPRTGVTYGTIVNAPAHVELDANDLKTLRIDHAPGSVRAAIALGPDEHARLGDQAPVGPTAAILPLPAPASREAKSRPFEGLSPSPATNTPARPPDRPIATLSHRDAIAKAVRDCAASRIRPGEFHVTVSSRLRLHVTGAGVVDSAQFSPPLNPDIQACAAESIYKLKIDPAETGQAEGGLLTIPIEFSY